MVRTDFSIHPLRWLFLDLNSYFASVEQQERPSLRNKPVAVVPMMVDSTCCLTASYEAKAFGIKTGTSVYEAKALCPGLQLVEARHEVYVKYHHAIVRAVESCMPVDVIMSIDEMAGRLHGSEQTPNKAIELAQRIKETLRKEIGDHVKCSIGIAPNRFLAKVAGDMQKPDGLTLLEGHQLPQKLYTLSLRDLVGIGRKMNQRLMKKGILNIEQLCSLDHHTMRELWGGLIGERYARWLQGEDLELRPTEHRSIGHSHVLEPELRSKSGAFRVAKRLLAKAAIRLRKIGYWSKGLSLSIRVDHDQRWDKFMKLNDVQDTPTLLESLEMLWEDFNEYNPTWVGVTLCPLVPPHHHTIPLFDDLKREKLSHLMDQINDRYGKNTLYVANLHDSLGKAHTKIAFHRVPDLSEF